MFMDYASQLVWIGANLVDRIFLTYLLIRFWGVSQFESWSVVLSIASLMSMFDFGMSLHFSNEITSLWEKKRTVDFEQIVGVANSLFAASACIGIIAVLAYLAWTAQFANHTLLLPVLLLSIAYALKIAVSGTLCLFRANQKYATLTAYVSAGEYARIIASILFCALGYGIDAVAGISGILIILLQVILPVVHAIRHFDGGSAGFAWVRVAETKQSLRSSLPYFLQAAPSVLLSSVPVFVLGTLQSGAGAIATFVTIRTLTSLPRALMQQSSIVFGLDAGRLIFTQDIEALKRLLIWTSRFVCVSSGAVAGAIFAVWKPVLFFWTSDQLKGSLVLVVAGLLPLLFAANATLTHNILVCAEKAGVAAIGRLLQVALSIVFFLVLPVQDVVLRMLLCLSLGEIFGFSLQAQSAVSKITGSGKLVNPAVDLARSLLAFVAVATPSWLLFSSQGTFTPITLALSFALAFLITCSVICFMGFASEDREEFIGLLRRKLHA